MHMLCPHCEEPIEPGHAVTRRKCISREGYLYMRPWHEECSFRLSVGGVAHLDGRCKCFGGDDPCDPPELSKRWAALAAYLIYKYRAEQERRITGRAPLIPLWLQSPVER